MLTIASPNPDRSLLTLAELRAAAGVSDNSKDAVLTILGNYVSAAITKACKVRAAGAIPPTLRLETVMETLLFKSQQRSLILARRPLVEIVSVTCAGSLLSTGDYQDDAAAGIIYRKSGVFGGMAEIVGPWHWWPVGDAVIEYSAGWATVPDDLKFAAYKFVQLEMARGNRDPLLTMLRIEGVSERRWFADPSKDSATPPEVMDLLIAGGYVADMVVA